MNIIQFSVKFESLIASSKPPFPDCPEMGAFLVNVHYQLFYISP